jgi:hypothetical protein
MRPRLTRLQAYAPLSYAAVVLADSPIAFLRCSEAASSPTLADSSGNSRTATLQGTWVTGNTGKNARLGSAVNRAAAAYFTVADSSPFRTIGDATWEVWFRLAGALTSGQVVRTFNCSISGETTTTNANYLLSISNVAGVHSYEWFHESGTGTNRSGSVPITYTPTNWNHAVLVRDVTAQNYQAFLNGVSMGTSSFASTSPPTGGSSAVFEFGRAPDSAAVSSVAADFDEIAMYGSKLSAARIFEHYRAGRRAA